MGAALAVAGLMVFASLSPAEARAQETDSSASTPQAAEAGLEQAGPAHVHNLIPQATDLADGRWRASVTIRVRDAAENPVAGATVTGDFAGVTRTCVTTAAHGGCTVSRTQGDLLPQPKFVVTDIQAVGGYDAAANHDVSGKDSNGTSIRVYQPLDDEPTHLVIAQDTTFTSRMILRPGDTVELRNGARMSFADGGYADWRGTPTSTWSKNGNTQNLTRNVKIFGDGDIRFEHGSLKSTIRFVEIDVQPIAETGRYPLHWHHAGEGSRGTVVTGVVIKNSTNRAYVPHASHGITFRDVIAKNTVLQGFWWDLPCGCDGEVHPRFHTANNSNDIKIYRMLVDGVRPPNGSEGHTLGGVVLGAGSGNVMRNSVVMNVEGGKNSSGYHWPSAANLNEGGNVWVFVDNRAHHVVDGIFVWQNDLSPHVIKRFKAWNVGQNGVDHGAYVNNYRYVDLDIFRMAIHALGDVTTKGGRIDRVVIKDHVTAGNATFKGTTIERVIVDNGDGRARGTFKFNANTGLSCSDITVKSIFPGTVIKVAGQRCNL